MLTNDFLGDNVARLGFGAMRLPVIDSDASNIDQVTLDAMVALRHSSVSLTTARASTPSLSSATPKPQPCSRAITSWNSARFS